MLDPDDIKYPLYTNEDIERPFPPVNSLLWKKDPMGTYVIFSTLDGRVRKFYTIVIGNKIRTKFNKLEDFQDGADQYANFPLPTISTIW